MIGPEFHGGGHPWHGACIDGVLALPNDTSKTYPQPSGGDCFKLAVPGHVAAVRNTAQLAADEAQGLQWLGHSLVCGDSSAGGGLQVYGKPIGLNCWIWAVSPEKKWKVNAGGLTVSGGVLSGSLALTEFGRFRPDGSEAPAASIAINAAAGASSAVKMKVLDVSDSGDKALVGLYAYAAGTWNGQTMNPTPAAVVEFSLSDGDPPSAAVTLVYGADDFTDFITPIGAVYELGTVKKFDVRHYGTQSGSIDPNSGFSVSRIALRTDTVERFSVDVRFDYTSTLLNPSPPNTTEYVAPAIDPVNLSGSSGGVFSHNVVTIAEITAAAQTAYVDTINSWERFNVVADAQYAANYGGAAGDVILTNVFRRHDDCAGGATGECHVYEATSTAAVVLIEETWTIGEETWKRAYGVGRIEVNHYRLTGWNEEARSASSKTLLAAETLTQGNTVYANYFKKFTDGATGAVSWYLFTATTFDQIEYTYYSCPDLYVPGTPYFFTYRVDAQYTLTVDGVDTALGTESFNVTPDNGVGVTTAIRRIHYPDKGNADRLECLMSTSTLPGYGQDQPAFAEIFFVNPCVGVYGMAVRKILATDATPFLLYKLAVMSTSTPAWAGWTADSPHDHKMSLQRETAQFARVSPPASSICFV